jgi:hypothetical protein
MRKRKKEKRERGRKRKKKITIYSKRIPCQTQFKMRQVFLWETTRGEYCRLGKVGNGRRRQKEKSECKGNIKKETELLATSPTP